MLARTLLVGLAGTLRAGPGRCAAPKAGKASGALCRLWCKLTRPNSLWRGLSSRSPRIVTWPALKAREGAKTAVPAAVLGSGMYLLKYSACGDSRLAGIELLANSVRTLPPPPGFGAVLRGS